MLASEYISTYHDYYHAGLGKRAASYYTTQHPRRVTALESAPHTTLFVAFGVTSYSLEIVIVAWLGHMLEA